MSPALVATISSIATFALAVLGTVALLEGSLKAPALRLREILRTPDGRRWAAVAAFLAGWVSMTAAIAEPVSRLPSLVFGPLFQLGGVEVPSVVEPGHVWLLSAAVVLVAPMGVVPAVAIWLEGGVGLSEPEGRR